jgi:hypothetical protein
MRTTMRNSLPEKCFWVVPSACIGKYLSCGFPIINFCNPGVHYETPYIIYKYIKCRRNCNICISNCFVKSCFKKKAWVGSQYTVHTVVTVNILYTLRSQSIYCTHCGHILVRQKKYAYSLALGFVTRTNELLKPGILIFINHKHMLRVKYFFIGQQFQTWRLCDIWQFHLTRLRCREYT